MKTLSFFLSFFPNEIIFFIEKQPPVSRTYFLSPLVSQFSRSVVSDIRDFMNRSTPGLPVHHQLPEFTQTHADRVGDVIQPSHLLSSPSPPAPNLSQHQGLFQRVNSLNEVAKVLKFQHEHQSFQ